MKELVKFLDNETAKVHQATDKNAAVSGMLKETRKHYKLDLRTVQEIGGVLEFVYKLENVTAAAVYITATAKKTPRVWENISYLIL